MLNGIKCVPCNGTGLTAVFSAQSVLRATMAVQRGNKIAAIRALREYTTGEVGLKAAKGYIEDVIMPEVEAIETEEYQVRSRRATRQTDAYGGYRDCDCIGDCNECMENGCKQCAEGRSH